MNTHHHQLLRLIEVRRYRDAKELLHVALAEAPDDPMLHCLAGRVALAEKDVFRAQDHAGQALRADPQHESARLLMFDLHVKAKRYADAEEMAIALIRERPYDADMLATYAGLMLVTLHLDKARALVREALRLDPGLVRARVLGVLLSCIDGRKSDANDQLAHLVREDPDSIEVANILLHVLAEQHRDREALEIGRQLLRVEPDDQELVHLLADLRVRTHWIALPAYPLRRYGWAASAALWAIGVISVRLLAKVDLTAAAVLAFGYVLYVIYSWTYPPLLKRWLLRRGF